MPANGRWDLIRRLKVKQTNLTIKHCPSLKQLHESSYLLQAGLTTCVRFREIIPTYNCQDNCITSAHKLTAFEIRSHGEK